MGFFRRFVRGNFFIKLRSWEYWPFGIVQAPFFIYWLWLSAKARSLLFFSASNPSITLGGMMGESKFDIQRRLPSGINPRTILIRVPADPAHVEEEMKAHGLSYPVIFKPDLGERGWMVKRINNDIEMKSYLGKIRLDFLIQEYVDLRLEFGVFYARYPSESKGRVISIVGKEMLFVTGDGKSTLEQLVQAKDRAKLQWPVLRKIYHERLAEILPDGRRLELVSIGNHCLGTKFLNRNDLITPRLSETFDKISRQIDGFFFGRFDLRTASDQDLTEGNVKVIELNGCGAEPAHIYEPGFSLWEAVRVLYRHWNYIYRISIENHARGVPYVSFHAGRAIYKRFKRLTSPV